MLAWVTVGGSGRDPALAQAIVEGSVAVGEEVPSKAPATGAVMCGAPALAALQAVAAVVPAEEAVVVVPVQAAAVGVAVVVVVVGDAGEKVVSIFRMFASEGRKMRHLIASLKNLMIKNYHGLILVLVIILASASAEVALGAVAVKQKTFSSPEEGVKALIDAARKNDVKGILEILGPEAKSIIESGDPVADNAGRERFVKSYDEANKLVKSGETEMVLEVGKNEWPFPIPLVKETNGWRFDTQEGKEEIINRRIGRNELDVIQVSLAIVDAEREYYRRDPDNDSLLQYAQKLISTKGKRDGLYWETKPGEEPSPLGPLVAQARGEGYKGAGGKPVPYHGYYYKLLTGQGKDAPGGAYDYLVRGKMMGGFGVVAYPAQYGSSGIMTFIVNHDGVVYQKDLGAKTASVAQSMTKFNPDKTWTPVKQ